MVLDPRRSHLLLVLSSRYVSTRQVQMWDWGLNLLLL